MSMDRVIVVSADNNGYLGWQCEVFHATWPGPDPVVFMAHKSKGEPPHPAFERILSEGGIVCFPPRWSDLTYPDVYLPLNTPASLHYAREAYPDLGIVLMDSDIVAVEPVDWPRALAGDFCGYCNAEYVGAADEGEGEGLKIMAPYVFPAGFDRSFAERWKDSTIALLDEWDIEHGDAGRRGDLGSARWSIMMYGYGMALGEARKAELVQMATTNNNPDALLETPLIHYAYRGRRFCKADYGGPDGRDRFWAFAKQCPVESDGTVETELLCVFRRAADYWG